MLTSECDRWVVVCAWWCIAARKWTRSSSTNKDDLNLSLRQGFSTAGAVTAWGVPAAFTIVVLVTRDVDADELTGNCYVGQQNTKSLLLLVLVPQLLYHISGTIFLLIGISSLLLPPLPSITPTPMLSALQANSLLRAREATKSPLDIQKRQKHLITRIGVFAWLYSLIVLSITSSVFYEFLGRDSWLRAPEPSTTPRAPSRPLLQFFVLKLVGTLSAGILTSAWICWPNLLSVWRRLPPCKQPPHKCQNHVPVVHCYTPAAASASSHQTHHLGHLTAAQHPLLQQHPSVAGQAAFGSHKKHRKHRKYHSGSETQV